MHIGNFPMPSVENKLKQPAHIAVLIRSNIYMSLHRMVYDYNRDIGSQKFPDLVLMIIGTDDKNAIKFHILALLHIRKSVWRIAGIQKCDHISPFFHGVFKTVQDPGKMFMHQSLSGVFRKDHPDISGVLIL